MPTATKLMVLLCKDSCKKEIEQPTLANLSGQENAT